MINKFLVFKNPRDKTQIATLARQILPYKPGFLISSFMQATKESFGYLCLDFRQVLKIDTKVNNVGVTIFDGLAKNASLGPAALMRPLFAKPSKIVTLISI